MLFPEEFKGMFYNIDKVVSRWVDGDLDKFYLYESRLYLTPKSFTVIRQAYDINNLLGDLGGVVRVLLTIFGVIFYPISQYLFYMNSAKKLYFARTKDTDLLSEA